ncbi:peptidase [Carboxylicivirga mesophila]|uniref:Peptidase n=1 Tax=Carboxylicivirga mesophila TaxID=1166478 RepID=A0ABS5KG95_9BACT|nr:S28 family serine protease [Carboxylicivirga mesophila]MBS2213832.1 peptidase [Carboxylicivirga mesophila]
MHIRLYIIASLLIYIGACTQPYSKPYDLLAASGKISFEKISTDSAQFEQSWLVWFEQPIDHEHPEKGHFKQRIWYSHKSTEAPVVMITEGYSANRNYTSELARLTNANQLIVEHRYFSQSCPDSLDWQYLTVEQAAFDHHRIIEFFKQLYKTKWATTGISKGGQTAIFHRALFPDDVDLSVPYVAPINLAREDHRLFDFFHNVGTEEERERIYRFQKVVLEKRNEIMPLFKQYAASKEYTFRMGDEKAYDLVVLEYPFSFWQWGSNVNDIPAPTASAEVLFEHLRNGSDIGYVSDQSWESIKPFFYQAYKELGYYAYTPGELKPLLKGFEEDTISSCMFAPGGDTLKFVPTMHSLMSKLETANPKIIAIIGENDPWGSTSLNNKKLTNTFRAVEPGGSHLARIKTLPDTTKEKVLEQINATLSN